jgi:glycosyltransferase involved in cell wall biosynthesis
MKVMWFVSSLEQKGGGERFVLETALALQAQGHEVVVVCDRLSEAASFDGRYDLSRVICLERAFHGRAGYIAKAFTKFRGFFSLLSAARVVRPELMLCQSEFDAIKLKFVSARLGCRYRVFVFGQMFQFKTDISRYSTVFRDHLETIVASRPGYRDTVALPPPKLSPVIWIVNELVSRLKYGALHQADRLFALSNQVKWEISLLYRREAVVVRAAIDQSYIDADAISAPAPVGQPMRLLSVCRLVDKKRVDVMIRGFHASGLDGTLRIVGGGPEAERLHEIARQSGSGDRIFFLGAVSDEQLALELKVADCFVSLDIGDFDITVVEAMGKGKRAIVAKDFDLSTFGDDFHGVVVTEPTPQAVAEAMRGVPTMHPPSAVNLGALHKLTWQWLASECVR